MPYSPLLHTSVNKSIGIAQAGPTDARSYWSDGIIYRYYVDENEVLLYLVTSDDRTGNFPIFIKRNAGSNVEHWEFRNGTAPGDLELMDVVITSPPPPPDATESSFGMVQLATDIEMQLTGLVTEDAKVASRLKIRNWWFEWITQNAQVVGATWDFEAIKVTGAPTTPAHGHIWTDAGNYKGFKSVAENFITSATNETLEDTRATPKERVMTASASGALLAAYDLEEELTTDSDIIGACSGLTGSPLAVFNIGNGFTSAIVPISGKVMFKGQKCRNTAPVGGLFYIWIAIDDNLVSRIPLG